MVKQPRSFSGTCAHIRDRLHRAQWVATELFLTFPPPELASITVVPLTSDETAGRFRVWVFVDPSPVLAWDRKVEGGFPELKVLVEGFLSRSFETSPAHYRVWTETTNKRQDSAREISGSFRCWSAVVDKHSVYIIVVCGLQMSCLSASRGRRSRCFSSCQRRHRLTVRGHQVHSPSTQPGLRLVNSAL